MLLIPIIGPSNSGKTTLTRFASLATGVPELISYTTRPMREGEVDGLDHHFVQHINASPSTIVSIGTSTLVSIDASPSSNLVSSDTSTSSHLVSSDASLPPSSTPVSDAFPSDPLSLLAHTIYGDHHYWVPLSDPLLSDHTNPTRCLLYIIDEDGLRSILNNPIALSKFDAIIPIRIERDPDPIASTIVSRDASQPIPSGSLIARTSRDLSRHPLPDLAYYRTIHNDTTIEFAQYDLSRVVMDIVRYVREGDHYHLIRWFAYHKDMMQ